jgi:hypothetical protein
LSTLQDPIQAKAVLPAFQKIAANDECFADYRDAARKAIESLEWLARQAP